MHSTPPPVVRRLVVAALLTGLPVPTALRSQPAAPQSAATEKAIELSPFIVKTEDDGWRAGNTMLSNRTNQSLKDVPVTIDALTPEFLADVGAYDAFSAAKWVANGFVEEEGVRAVTTATSGTPADANRYAFRGIPNEGGPTRNLFTSGVDSDTYNVERIDFGRGSNSLMFGDAEPGGQGNVYTKRANLGRKFGNILTQIGSFDSYRFNFDYNLPVSEKLAGRLNLTKSREGRDFDYNRFGVEALHAMVTYHVFKNTLVRVDAEAGTYDRVWGTNNQRIAELRATGRGFNQKWTVLPDNTVILNTALPAVDRANASGAILSLQDIDPGGFPRHYNWGPDNMNIQDFTTVTAALEQRLGPVALQFTYNQQKRANGAGSTKMSNRMSTDSAGRRFIDFTYNGALIEVTDRNYQAMANYKWTPARRMSQFFVATAQLRRNQFRAVNLSERNELDNPGAINAAAARIWYRVYADDAGAYDPAFTDRHKTLPETSSFRARRDFLTQDIWQYKVFRVYSLSASGEYLGGRLLSTMGARLDTGNGLTTQPWNVANISPRGEAATPGSYADHPERYTPINSLADINEMTKNFGLVYKLTASVNLYASYATSFRAANGAAVNFVNEPLGQQHGKTIEVGIKSDFFDRKLVWNLNWYDLVRSNVEAGFTRTGLTEDELEDLFNPNNLSSLDPKYLLVNGTSEKRNVFSKGVESTVIVQPREGLTFRIAAAYKDVKQDASFPRFRELLAAAIARGNENPAYVSAAQNIMNAEGAKGNIIIGSSATPFTFNYAASYSFSRQGGLKGWAVGINGNYNDTYVFRYLNNVPFEGGKRFSLHGMASHRSKLFQRSVVYRLNVSNLIGTDYQTVDVVTVTGGGIRNVHNYGNRLAFKLTSALDF